MRHINDWIELESSHVAAMRYDAENSELYVRYKGGQTYSVTANQEEADGLKNASSPGRYVNLMFKGKMKRVS